MFECKKIIQKMIDNEHFKLYNVHIETDKCSRTNKTEEILCRATQNTK